MSEKVGEDDEEPGGIGRKAEAVSEVRQEGSEVKKGGQQETHPWETEIDWG